MASVDSDRHWVEDLFPPAFGLTVNDVLSERFQETLGGCPDGNDSREDPGVGPSVFEQHAEGISPLDVSAIRNVYERVWLMSTLEAQERQRREKEEVAQHEKEPKLKLGRLRDTQSKKKVDANTSTSDLQLKTIININEPCIWSTQEISVLRTVFKAAKAQNAHLQAALTLTTEDFDRLKAVHSMQRKTLEARSKSLNEASKANQRLQILCENLKSHLDKANKKISALTKEVADLKMQRATDWKRIHQQQMELDKERLERKKVEMDLEKERRESLQRQYLREEELRLDHEREVGALERKMAELEKKLQQEFKDHERSKKGLEHLRQHFSSLPLSGEYVAAGAVIKDQLSNWTY